MEHVKEAESDLFSLSFMLKSSCIIPLRSDKKCQMVGKLFYPLAYTFSLGPIISVGMAENMTPFHLYISSLVQFHFERPIQC